MEGDLPDALGRALLDLLTGKKRARADRDSDSEDDLTSVPAGASDKRLYYKRIAKKHPGLITERELATVGAILDPSIESTRYSEAVTAQFLIRAFLPSHPISKIGQQRYRELRTEGEAIDTILRGDLAAATDVLIGRITAVQRSVVAGHDRVGRWFEIIPGRDDGTSISLTDETVAAGIEAAEAKRAKLLSGAG